MIATITVVAEKSSDLDRWPFSIWLLWSLDMRKQSNFNAKWRLWIKDSCLKLVIFLFSLLKLANSLANSLGTETASLPEPDGTASFFFKVSFTSCVDVFEFLLCFNQTYSEFLCNLCPAVQFLVLGFYYLAKLIVWTIIYMFLFLPWRPQYWGVWNAFWDSCRSLRSLEWLPFKIHELRNVLNMAST